MSSVRFSIIFGVLGLSGLVALSAIDGLAQVKQQQEHNEIVPLDVGRAAFVPSWLDGRRGKKRCVRDHSEPRGPASGSH